jgi:diaminopimelate decarboxylase
MELLDPFVLRHGELHCEGLPVARMAEEMGTPLYVYSGAALANRFRAFAEGFAGVPHLICFAMKANANLATLRLFASLGGGADVVSGGELFRALKAGVPPERIVYAGVGKTRDEVAYALKSDILMFNIESVPELRLVDAVAGEMGARARIALRVNPDVDPKTHPYISTGLKKSKFGIDIAQADEAFALTRSLRHVEVVGVHQHIGSQITEVGPFVDAIGRVAELVRRLRAGGFGIRYLDIGGGLGITYHEETPPIPGEVARAVLPIIQDLGCTLVMEPGRFLVGNAGILVTRVLYVKRGAAKHFVIVDAAMNDLARPSLYNAYHAIQPVRPRAKGTPLTGDVVGPICESGDFLAKDRRLPPLETGDLLAVMSAGAYGFSMASNYNARPRAAEVLVRGDRYAIIRERESYEDLIRGEHIPDDL